MLPGSRSHANPCCSGIPRVPVGILTPTESYLRTSRSPHFCPTRDASVGLPTRHRTPRVPAVGHRADRVVAPHAVPPMGGSGLKPPTGLICAHPRARADSG